MMRRPTTREGAIVPQLALGAAVVLAAGMVGVSYGWLIGWWLVVGGALGLVTTGLLFWRLIQGMLVASPVWVLFFGAVMLRAGAPGSVAGWLIAGGALGLVSLGLVGINRPIGGA
jgi:type IV secretion system protein VirD4